jgi:hypothetical protein
MVKDDNDLNEYKSVTDYFFKYDEQYPMQDYQGGPPEWALFEKANFATQKEGDPSPQVTFTSIVDKNELMPQHEDNTLQYHDLHNELESWTAFRALPELMKFDTKMNDHLE